MRGVGDLLALSSRIIDEGVPDEPVNRVTNELSELADDLAIVERFSHSVALRTDEGLVCFDASRRAHGSGRRRELRRWSPAPVHTLVYTHGHADHVGGSGAFAATPTPAATRAHGGRPRERARPPRPLRATNDWNLIINARQFGGVRPR